MSGNTDAQAATDALAKEILKNADPDEWDTDSDGNAVDYVRRMEAAFDDQRQETITAVAARDGLAVRVAELVSEGNGLRGLVAEILGGFGPSGDGRFDIAVITPEQIAKWRVRAGLTPEFATAGTEHLAAELAERGEGA